MRCDLSYSRVCQNSRLHNVFESLRKNASAIAGAFFAFLSIGLSAVLACGIVHPGVVVALAVAAVLSGALLLLPIFECLSPPIKLFIGRKEAPPTISILYTVENLDCLLIRYCPFYFVSKFIELGSKESADKENLSPEMYWTSPLGFAEERHSIFDPCVWLLFQVMTKGEYQKLLSHAEGNTWGKAARLIRSLQKRMEDKLENLDPECQHLFQEVSEVKERIASTRWILHLCKHKPNWYQVELFRQVDISAPSFFFDYEERVGGLSGMIGAIYPLINEGDISCDINLTLLTWKAWWLMYASLVNKTGANPGNREIVQLLAQHSRNKPIINDGLPEVAARYRFDYASGKSFPLPSFNYNSYANES
ncbi:DUF1389 domain-containing protein [Chlamydia vaughanii]|uniref:DUF1389 domain-containing protein n=1 Tax=Chlamydia vaughanii TaxID=3112552 RepID=UPI0032B11078